MRLNHWLTEHPNQIVIYGVIALVVENSTRSQLYKILSEIINVITSPNHRARTLLTPASSNKLSALSQSAFIQSLSGKANTFTI